MIPLWGIVALKINYIPAKGFFGEEAAGSLWKDLNVASVPIIFAAVWSLESVKGLAVKQNSMYNNLRAVVGETPRQI